MLIECQECLKQYSDKAEACPSCGHPTEINLEEQPIEINKIKEKNFNEFSSKNMSNKISYCPKCNKLTKISRFEVCSCGYEITLKDELNFDKKFKAKHEIKKPAVLIQLFMGITILMIFGRDDSGISLSILNAITFLPLWYLNSKTSKFEKILSWLIFLLAIILPFIKQ